MTTVLLSPQAQVYFSPLGPLSSYCNEASPVSLSEGLFHVTKGFPEKGIKSCGDENRWPSFLALLPS